MERGLCAHILYESLSRALARVMPMRRGGKVPYGDEGLPSADEIVDNLRKLGNAGYSLPKKLSRR